MFSEATAGFVRQIDRDGGLISVSRLNDSHKLVPAALVVKRKRFWFWQRPKYQPSDFTLSELLLGDVLLSPVVSEEDFVGYQGTFGDIKSATLNAKAGVLSVNLEGRGTSKLQLSFGKLKKQQVDVKELLQDSSARLLNMQHGLVQQVQKRDEVLAILKERVFTTSPCSITGTHKEQAACGGVLSLVSKLGNTVEVCVKDHNTVEVDCDVSLEIPAATVIAYSLLEMEIKKDGHYELCLQPGTLGGFEHDSGTSSPSNDPCACVVDGFSWSEKILEKAPLSALNNELQELESYLQPLAGLPHPTRCTLFQRLMEVLRDRVDLSLLENTLEEWCRARSLDVTEPPALSEGLSSSAWAFLDLFQIGNGVCGTPAHLTAAHLLVSAMEELSDETLNLLSKCCPDILDAINELICQLRGSCNPLSMESVPVPLQDGDASLLSERLLESSNITLRREMDRMWAETGDQPSVLPLVFCLTVRGLSYLLNEQQ